jgi:D-alanyl-D-alanine dipeptidase
MTTTIFDRNRVKRANLRYRYRILESSFVQYKDLLTINKCNEETDKEKFTATGMGRYLPNWNDMEALTGEPLVRETVFKKLTAINASIRNVNPNWQLLVTDGFRDPSTQTRKHEEQFNRFMKIYNDPEKAKAEAQYWIASPDVASHPTGGAVDVAVLDKERGCILDYGSDIYDLYTKKQYVFSPEIDILSPQYANRMFLRTLMLEANFAPFDGEWWHFSYGDKEWAVYYGKDEYLYRQKQTSEIEIIS